MVKTLILPRPTVSDARHYIWTCLQAAFASELASKKRLFFTVVCFVFAHVMSNFAVQKLIGYKKFFL